MFIIFAKFLKKTPLEAYIIPSSEKEVLVLADYRCLLEERGKFTNIEE
ncbi:MAG: hypothetical protein ABF649_18845 [Bacillus sp. (in: firmicutes)]